MAEQAQTPAELLTDLPEGTARKQYSSMGLIAYALVAASVEDYGRIAGDKDAALKDANDNTVYRGQLNAFRSEICALVEKETGIERMKEVTNQADIDAAQAKVDAGEEGVTIPSPEYSFNETEAKYFKRVCETEGVEPSHFQHLAVEASKQLTFTPGGRERSGPKPKTPTKSAYGVADKVMADGKGDKLAEFLTEQLGYAVTLTGEAAADRETLAQGVHANELREQREAAKRREEAYMQV